MRHEESVKKITIENQLYFLHTHRSSDETDVKLTNGLNVYTSTGRRFVLHSVNQT